MAVILLFVAGWTYTRVRTYRTLDTEAVAAIRPWLVAAYSRQALEEVGGKAVEDMTADEMKAFSDKVLAAGRVEIVSIRARGSGDDTVCRVEVLVDGKPPPDGKNPRYFEMNYSNLLGWTYEAETRALAYYLTLF